jgi:hypothetical protein
MYAQSACHTTIFKGNALIKDILLVSAIINTKEDLLFDGIIQDQCLLTGCGVSNMWDQI